ncbi:hypothetical protein GmRootV118_17530 [Variovorax sp. V118]|uniref:hypothetical protein n=1 Tax=Variovorax sp. V118 TaxID=3065954 RepID=UPI0034E849FA
MHVKSLSALDHAEVVELATHAAERGDDIAHANPFSAGCWRHAVFRDVFVARTADLQPVG